MSQKTKHRATSLSNWKAQVYTTLRCNLNCPGCGQRWRAEKAFPDLDPESYLEFLRGLNRLADARPRWVSLTGGEPTLWPHLKEAIETAHAYAYKVSVSTNGLLDCDETLAAADLVQVSNYGAINALARLRMQKSIGRKLRVFNSVHIKTPLPDGGDECLPAECVCRGFSLMGDMVYVCPGAVLRCPVESGISVYTPSWPVDVQRLPCETQPLCRICTANQNNHHAVRAPFCIEAYLWETTTHRLWHIPWRMNGLRKVARRVLAWKRGKK